MNTTLMNFKEKYIGDKRFYKMLWMLVLPIVIQQGITNFVSLLDNLMVGDLGTIQMSAVSIVNQLFFVFNLAVFGGLSGASIYGTQFYGRGDWTGMRDTFRFKMIFAILASAVAVGVFITFEDELLMMFLQSEQNTPEQIAETLAEAKRYLRVAIVGLVPFAIVQVYSDTLRESSETVTPMIGGIIAIAINIIFNYLLIFGKLGFPKMGVAGAALATVMSRFVEMIFVVIVTHVKSYKYKFIIGVYRKIRIPGNLIKKIVITGAPLMLNELLWSLGQTFINSNYAKRGIVVIAATNITSTAWNLFCVIMFAMGSAVIIMVGQKLGEGDPQGAIDTDNKLLFVSVAAHTVMALLIIALSPVIPLMYNVEPEVRALATKCLIVAGLSLPIHATLHVIYFTIRSGGKTIITFLFDSGFTWVVPCVISFVLCRYTALNIIWIYVAVQFSDILKLLVGIPLLKSGFWANCVINEVGGNE